jgi:hypothetical protein
MYKPKLKTHCLTNLADARACAGWGIDFIGFSLERGSMYKIPLVMLQQIISWLSVAAIVIDIGNDTLPLEEAQNLESESPIFIQLQDPNITGENHILSLYQIPSDFYSLSEKFAFLELCCPPPWPILPDNCFINTDYCAFAEAFAAQPFGISAGKKISGSNLQLDFDKLDSFRQQAGYNLD